MSIPFFQLPDSLGYLSMDGQRKILTAPLGVKVNENVKAVLIELVSSSACVVCFELLEKTLQTRCCRAILCAQCYEGINVPKKCPRCNVPWKEGISMALLEGDRNINVCIASALCHFQDIAFTEKDTEKSQRQMEALKLLRENSREAQARQTMSDYVSRRLGFRVSEGCLDELTRLRAEVTNKDNLPRFDRLFFEIYEQYCINYSEIRIFKLVEIDQMTGCNQENMAHLYNIFRRLTAESSVHNDAVTASFPVAAGARLSEEV